MHRIILMILIMVTAISHSTKVAAQLPSYIPRDGLVAYLPLDTNTDDVSGKGSIFDNTSVSFESTINNKGITERYAVFNGTDEVAAHLLARDAARFMTPQYSYTVRLKLKQARQPGASKMYQGLVCLGALNWTWGPAYNLVLNGSENSVLVSSHWNSDPALSGEVMTTDGRIQKDNWERAVVVYDGSQMKLYLNGQVIGFINVGIDYSNHDRFIIGANADNPDGRIMAGFNGYIDDFAFWNRALSSDEVEKIFTGKDCDLGISSDSILGYRKVETHQVVTYALRYNPSLSYKWIATGGYMLGASTNHYCDVIWGYDKFGSVCCIVSDSTCSDTLCLTTTINNATTGGIAGEVSDAPTMSVRPNPANDVIDISTALGDNQAHYELIDVTGLVIQRTEGVQARMSVANIVPAVYHVVQRDLHGNVIGMQRVVVQR